MNFVNKKPQIIILTGKAGSGKSKTASLFINAYKNKKAISLAYSSYLKSIAKNVLAWDGNDKTKPRTFLQDLGNKLIRKINKSFLINRMIEDIKVYSYFYDVIIISDARFVEEIESIKSIYKKVLVIKITRDKKNNLTEKQSKDITETALDKYKLYDYIIENNGSVKKLEEKVKQIVGNDNK